MPKILVVDDDDGVRNVVRLLLIQEGYDVIDAEFGQRGYSKAQSEAPDLILLDLMMPVMDGFEVLRKLKKNPQTEPIPVVILTAKIDVASERECMRLGAVDYIKKPWGPRELEDRIGMALRYPELDRRRGSDPGKPLVGGQEEERQSPELSQPPEPQSDKPPVGGGDENRGKPVLIAPRKFRTRRFRIKPEGDIVDDPGLSRAGESDACEPGVGGEEEDPETPGMRQAGEVDDGEPGVGGEEDATENQDSSRARRFRTRSFRIRPDGVDPASLL